MSSCKKAIRVVNVSAKTINLARESLRRRPPICPTYPKPPAPPAAQIRVCSPEELKNICPPDPCDCPPPPPPTLTAGQKLVRAILAAVKLTLILGVIKWTDDLGIWGDTESTAKVSEAIRKRLAPILNSEGDNDSGQYYGLTYSLATMWNNGVTKVFYVIGVLPSEMTKKIAALMQKKDEEEKPEDKPPEPPKKAAAVPDKRRNPMLM